MRFEALLAMDEIEENFKDIDLFSGVMEGLQEALAYIKGQAATDTFARTRSLPTINVAEAVQKSFETGVAGMNNTIEYKNHVSSVEFSEIDGVFFGKVLGIHALISYEGTTKKELMEHFHNVVDDYLDFCTTAEKESD